MNVVRLPLRGFLVIGAAATMGLVACGGGSTTGNGGSSGGDSSTGAAGATGNGGSVGSAGTTGVAGAGAAGTTGAAGNASVAGTTGAAGRGGAAAGAAGRGGQGGSTSGAAGRAGTTGGGTGGPATMSCTGAQPMNPNPFGCTFAWGRQTPGGSGSLSSYNYLQMMATWVESGIRRDGSFPSCGGCSWLTSRMASTNLIPVYYAYMIGYFGHMNDLPDQNLQPGGPNLATGGAALIKANRAKIVQMYADYARMTYQAWSTRPLVWLLEGDMIQYTETSQTSPLTMAELGQLAADITCAIKGNMPNAVVAINHSTWNSNEETNSYWTEMKRAQYDLVWTTGVGDNGNFIEEAGKAGYYNATTATYPYIHQFTGKNIVVDTSYGASAMSDSWSNQTKAALDVHIGNGVIGINIANNPPANYQTIVQGLQLASTCR